MFVDRLYSGLWGGRGGRGGRGGIERQPRDAETRYDSCRGRVKGKVKKCVKMQEKEEKNSPSLSRVFVFITDTLAVWPSVYLQLKRAMRRRFSVLACPAFSPPHRLCTLLKPVSFQRSG